MDKGFGLVRIFPLYLTRERNGYGRFVSGGRDCQHPWSAGRGKGISNYGCPARFKKLKKVILDTGSEKLELEISQVKFFKNMVILKFRNFDTINDVEKYKGKGLFVTREQAVKCEKDEYFIADLIGIEVVTEHDEPLGELIDVMQTGANDVYVVQVHKDSPYASKVTDKKKELLLPAIKDCILGIDMEKKDAGASDAWVIGRRVGRFMNFYILTLFPEMVMGGLNTSIIGRAMEAGILKIETVNIRDYSTNKHQKVDDYPYGGGAGMLMQAQPVYDAWRSVVERIGKKPRCIYVTPQGKTFTQKEAKTFAAEEEVILLCGHYEGIDERVLEEIVTDYMSIGDYVLTGGELPAMVMVDAISRMVPGVLGNEESGSSESFEGNLLEYPQYSRPEEWNGRRVPQILLSGHHKNIEIWRRQQSILLTRERRPDLLKKAELTEQERNWLKEQL